MCGRFQRTVLHWVVSKSLQFMTKQLLVNPAIKSRAMMLQ